ncbi:molybdopterin synthase sulfur carrier subunit [Luteibacter rhizovicinus]|uniref:Molybdopterin synthase sulfur carrier subunit n=1 Tax=Luteibacter rhizovicinus TaxID=242606 RepID=A0A4R3YIG1_9GAMM|nr:MoaD/ThiS family protein [Luteibacter rhizovicinus]TCV91891.1 molybdopterin synthase sulfur carrier subunit [Luteibacter rhizovicinus]
MKHVVFELFANLRKLAGTEELRVEAGDAVLSVGDALTLLARERPELAASLERCACVSGDTIVRRVDALPADGRIALLPPVAGG